MHKLRASFGAADSFVPAFTRHRAVASAALFIAALAASALVNRVAQAHASETIAGFPKNNQMHF
jgi:hypothetical protein